MTNQSSNKLSAMQRFARFVIGSLTGFSIAGLFWLYSIYFHVSISVVQGIIGGFFLAISCGVIATISGLDKIFDNLPNI